MTPKETEILKQRLLTYPGANLARVEQQISLYEERERMKKHLMLERGYSNFSAEIVLEKRGMPRPPGWKSVFFYPGRLLPRLGFIASFIFIAVAAFLFL